MASTETMWQIQKEIAMGYEWGNPESKVEQTEENRELWESLSAQTAEIAARGHVVDIPWDWASDVGDL